MMPLKPLRYNPGLKCDAALEAMRPERNPNHKSISAGDKRIAQPQMPPMEPMPQMIEGPPMMMPQPMPQMMAPMGPYEAPYPTDLLSQIKMRNRRFQQSCAMEGMQQGPPPMMRGPMMASPPQMMMMMQPQPQMTEDIMVMTSTRSPWGIIITPSLNITRR